MRSYINVSYYLPLRKGKNFMKESLRFSTENYRFYSNVLRAAALAAPLLTGEGLPPNNDNNLYKDTRPTQLKQRPW